MLDASISTQTLQWASTPAAVFGKKQKHKTAKVRVESNQLCLHATDKARVGWVDISLPEPAFESIDSTPMDEVVNADKIAAFTGLFEDDTTTDITIDPSQGSQGVQLRAGDLAFTAPVCEPRYFPQVDINREFDQYAEMTLSGDALDPAIGLADDITSRMTFGADATAGVFFVAATGKEGDSLRTEFDLESGDNFGSQHIKSVFQLDYLTDIQDVIPSDVTLQLVVRDDNPMSLQYSIPDCPGTVTFGLKPSIGTG